jgi:hypothetical protein
VVVESARAERRQSFNDVGALIYYLKAVEWDIPGLDMSSCREALRQAHDRMRTSPLVVRQFSFLLVALKPKNAMPIVPAERA